MTDGPATLARPVRIRVVAHYGGQLLVVAAALSAVPVVVALLDRQARVALAQAAVAGLFGLCGWALRRVRAEPDLQRNEALALVALAFVVTPLVASVVFTVEGMTWVDALFEAVSGVTTTGLTTLADPGRLSRALLFTRAWMQWYGGLGVIVLTVALLGGQGMAARRLYAPVEGQALPHTTRSFARRILVVYLGLSVGAWAVLAVAGGSPFTALLHTLSAVSTGGFSPLRESLQALPTWSERYLVIAFSLAGAVPLAVILERGLRHSGRDAEIKTLVGLCALQALALAVMLHRGQGLAWGEALAHGGLLGMSAQSTTGFSAVAPAGLDDASKIVLCLSMLTGGCLGSTAGGLKLLRLLICYRVVQVAFMRTALPERAVLPAKLSGVSIAEEDVRQALVVIALFLLALLASWTIFVASGHAGVDALFETTSALATTGLSTGITSADLPTHLKLLLCVDMILGRVEVFALLVLLYPRTWYLRRSS